MNTRRSKKIIDAAEPISGEEKGQVMEGNGKREKRLREWILDELVVASLKDDAIAEAVCILAGFLSNCRKPLRTLLEKEMKPSPRWSQASFIMAWISYAHFLMDEDGDKIKARKKLIQKEEKRIGKKISDGRMNNLLSYAIHTIPLDRFPDHIHYIIKERLDRGKKVMHLGW